ncbi:metalloregulator ArsR/SmtB family transcription factor [Nocardioides zeae]|uniref:Metalloregulator ArsR/SmtB family transcription factor n=1 Tax=Nocardioides imazamoxiresistens TaxID=3231893 RepID=A0ABU3Q1C1_9ACTN|nr:metalloregulator ArsR/SmtB family transcription factor [Nocardioides zeae]MDT9595184.1 metalloregulator ArsR/SmtB family transcription factor [Nocardioides zeae]
MDDGVLDRAFAALADPTRRDIVARLCDGDATVNEVAAPYAMSLQAVSKHLAVLERAGLVRRTSVGRQRRCSVETATLDALTTWLDRHRRAVESRYRSLDLLLARTGSEQPDQPTDPARRPS